jgi:predicted secreted protein
MTWVTGVLVYIVLWWLVWFAVLPLRVKVPEQVELGQATSAPENPRLLWKAGLASTITAGLWLLVYWVVIKDPFGIGMLAPE